MANQDKRSLCFVCCAVWECTGLLQGRYRHCIDIRIHIHRDKYLSDQWISSCTSPWTCGVDLSWVMAFFSLASLMAFKRGLSSSAIGAPENELGLGRSRDSTTGDSFKVPIVVSALWRWVIFGGLWATGGGTRRSSLGEATTPTEFIREAAANLRTTVGVLLDWPRLGWDR